MDRVLTRCPGARVFATAVAGLAAACVLTACSSGGSSLSINQPSGSAPSTTTAPTTTSTQGPGSSGGGQSSGGGVDGGGGFNEAGRLSDSFSGDWPSQFNLAVENTSTTTDFIGTVSVTDCSGDGHNEKATPSFQPVDVPPGGSQPEQFSFDPNGETGQLAVHTLCVQLTDEQGNPGPVRTVPLIDHSVSTDSSSPSSSPSPSDSSAAPS